MKITFFNILEITIKRVGINKKLLIDYITNQGRIKAIKYVREINQTDLVNAIAWTDQFAKKHKLHFHKH